MNEPRPLGSSSGDSLVAARISAGGIDLDGFRRAALDAGTVVWHDSRATFGCGEAELIELPHGLDDRAALAGVGRRLASIPFVHDEADGSSVVPLALGTLAFDRAAAGVLTVPSETLVELDGHDPVVVLVGRNAEEVVARARALSERRSVAPRDRPRDRGGPPDSFRLSSVRPHNEFLELVAAAVTEIRFGSFDKVVLVREVLVEANRAFLRREVIERLRSLYPSCATFSIDGFVGASPELLVAREGREVRSHPLAGTIGRSGDAATDRRLEVALLASAKERAEHRVVVEAVAEALAPLCSELAIPSEPSIVELRNVSHLGSLVTGRLAPQREAGDESTALGLVARLHPTPAVAGTPRDEALEWIAKHEGVERGPYAGPVGWVDAAGDGEWFVGIRAGVLDGRRARLFAGVGVVGDSVPEAELAETQLKLQALLAAAVRP